MFVDALDTNCVTVLLPATFAIVERLSKGDTVGPWDDDKYFVIVSAPIPKTDDESNERLVEDVTKAEGLVEAIVVVLIVEAFADV